MTLKVTQPSVACRCLLRAACQVEQRTANKGIIMTREDIAQYEDAWRQRGYWIEETDAGPIVEGDAGQFAADAVANDCDAAKLMEFIRTENPEEYDRYREDALDDDIDLDYSQDTFIKGAAAAGYR